MTKIKIPESIAAKTFPGADHGVRDARKCVPTPQTESPSYELAFADEAFLLEDEQRGIRLQLEWQKPDLRQQQLGIESTIVVFGSARTPSPEAAERRLADVQEALNHEPNNPGLQAELNQAKRVLKQSTYYAEARELGRLVSASCQVNGKCNFVVTTGGGPGIMEAANRGAADVDAKSIGLNIVLPHEQAPNPYMTPELCFQFHYFAIRKMHFLMRAKALVCFPGGFGTMDELFEALTLIQTGKVPPIPILLVGKEFWEQAVNFDFFVQEGLISPSDRQYFQFVESAQEAWDCICKFHAIEQRKND